MQGDGQAAEAPGMDHLYNGSNSGWDNYIRVTGFRFLRGVADEVSCDGEYKKK